MASRPGWLDSFCIRRSARYWRSAPAAVPRNGDDSMLLISQILIWVSILVLAGAVLALARQVGVLHERIAPVGALAIAKGPQAGEAAPKVSGRTLAGTHIDVAGPMPPGQLRLLFFVSPTCPVCKNLLPTAVKFAETEALELLLVGDGEDGDYRSMAERHGIAAD